MQSQFNVETTQAMLVQRWLCPNILPVSTLFSFVFLAFSLIHDRKTAVSAYFSSKQLLPFGFAYIDRLAISRHQSAVFHTRQFPENISRWPDAGLTLARCWTDVGPSSTTLAQHQPTIGPTPRACWHVIPDALLGTSQRINILENAGSSASRRANQYGAPLQSPKAVSAHLKSEQILPFGFARQSASPWFAFTLTACSESNSPNRCNAVRPVTSLGYGEPLWMWLTAEVSTTLTNELSSVRTVWLNLDVLGGRLNLITITELSPCCQQHHRKQSSGSMLHQRHRVLAQR